MKRKGIEESGDRRYPLRSAFALLLLMVFALSSCGDEKELLNQRLFGVDMERATWLRRLLLEKAPSFHGSIDYICRILNRPLRATVANSPLTTNTTGTNKNQFHTFSY